jgi:hypothetical protein
MAESHLFNPLFCFLSNYLEQTFGQNYIRYTYAIKKCLYCAPMNPQLVLSIAALA